MEEGFQWSTLALLRPGESALPGQPMTWPAYRQLSVHSESRNSFAYDAVAICDRDTDGNVRRPAISAAILVIRSAKYGDMVAVARQYCEFGVKATGAQHIPERIRSAGLPERGSPGRTCSASSRNGVHEPSCRRASATTPS
jgi:hypothetical protein